MKTRYLLLIIAALLTCAAGCKKEGKKNTSVITSAIVGRWYVNKEEVTGTMGGLAKQMDTVYNSNAFDTGDYALFVDNGTAVISSSGGFELTGKTVVKDGSGNVVYASNQYNFSLSATTLTLKSTLQFPNANTLPNPRIETIVQLDNTTLVLSYTITNNAGMTVTYKTYYVRDILES